MNDLPDHLRSWLDDLLPWGSVHALAWDPVNDVVRLVRLHETDYRRASFLDARYLESAMPGVWVPSSDFLERLRGYEPICPLQFIFHAGHVGSTLVTRLLGEIQGVLTLREPATVRTIADAYDVVDEPYSLFDRASLQTRSDAFLALWRRGFPGTRTVVVKPTSWAVRMAPNLLNTVQSAKAICLNVSADAYLASYLDKDVARAELRGQSPERIRRLSRSIGAHGLVLASLTQGEVAAMSWLTERLTQVQMAQEFPSRVRIFDFDVFLKNLSRDLTSIIAHLEIDASSSTIESILRGDILHRHAKAQDQRPYSARTRDELLGRTRLEHRDEIRLGHKLLERLAATHKEVAQVL
jgi:hypothetical protein